MIVELTDAIENLPTELTMILQTNRPELAAVIPKDRMYPAKDIVPAFCIMVNTMQRQEREIEEQKERIKEWQTHLTELQQTLRRLAHICYQTLQDRKDE